ncbi:hypothetical protein [Micromonospora luteifusca]|uniref:hypothetical protein n=1 Tax=Micromonospora luteifusca TaxID=709860 RepID=UPI00339EDC4D
MAWATGLVADTRSERTTLAGMPDSRLLRIGARNSPMALVQVDQWAVDPLTLGTSGTAALLRQGAPVTSSTCPRTPDRPPGTAVAHW